MTEFMTPPAGFPRRESITPEVSAAATPATEVTLPGTPATAAAPEKTYLQRILETPVNYPEHIIEVMREFKRHHKIGTEPDQSRLDAMTILAREIASAYDRPAPIVRMDEINGGDSAYSSYSPNDHSITMRGKLSIITFLHEIAHAVLNHNEHMARVWSLNLFNKIYPKSFAKLRGDGHFMTMDVSNERIMRPERVTQRRGALNINQILDHARRAMQDTSHLDVSTFFDEPSPYDQPASTILNGEGGGNEPAS